MNLSATLNRYLSHAYIKNLAAMVGILWGIIYLFNTVELLRRASNKNVPLGLVFEMGFLKLPYTGLTIFSFAILFAAMYTFWRLNRRSELVVVRAAGFSVWQFLSPVIGVAVMTAVLIITVVNPFSALMLGRFKMLEAKYLTHRVSEVVLFDEGMWLRQGMPDSNGGGDDDSYIILHAGAIKMPGWRLQNVTALYFDKSDEFLQRVDAPSATLSDKAWVFDDAVINTREQKMTALPVFRLPTELTAQEIEESFASPDTMSVWRLPAFIRTVQSTGFDATRLKLHFQSLLAMPFLFAAMILLAAAVSLHPPRFRSTLTLMMMGIAVGFATFFTSSFLMALGSSHQIPVLLAAWSPAFIMLLLGIAAMLGMEEG